MPIGAAKSTELPVQKVVAPLGVTVALGKLFTVKLTLFDVVVPHVLVISTV